MKTIEKVWTIELTEQEIETVARALRGEVQFIKQDIETYDLTTSEGTQKAVRRKHEMDEAKELRNAFGRLIGRTYMGEDA